MAMLHLVSRSPFREDALDTCLRIARPGSALLLYEDGVYGGVRGTGVEERLAAAANELRVCVLEPDLAARGPARRLRSCREWRPWTTEASWTSRSSTIA